MCGFCSECNRKQQFSSLLTRPEPPTTVTEVCVCRRSPARWLLSVFRSFLHSSGHLCQSSGVHAASLLSLTRNSLLDEQLRLRFRRHRKMRVFHSCETSHRRHQQAASLRLSQYTISRYHVVELGQVSCGKQTDGWMGVEFNLILSDVFFFRTISVRTRI